MLYNNLMFSFVCAFYSNKNKLNLSKCSPGSPQNTVVKQEVKSRHRRESGPSLETRIRSQRVQPVVVLFVCLSPQVKKLYQVLTLEQVELQVDPRSQGFSQTPHCWGVFWEIGTKVAVTCWGGLLVCVCVCVIWGFIECVQCSLWQPQATPAAGAAPSAPPYGICRFFTFCQPFMFHTFLVCKTLTERFLFLFFSFPQHASSRSFSSPSLKVCGVVL